MTDSVNVFDPAFRVTNNSTGAPVNGAVIKFYVGGTAFGTPKTVYSDAGLSTALGTSVTTDSLGCPTSDGTTPTLIYTDTSPYDIRIETSAGVLIKAFTNVKGAVETGTGGGGSVISTRTVETKSLNYTVLAADQGKAFAGNCTGGDVTFTLPSAAASDVGNGWLCTISHAGSANQVIIATTSSQTITSGAQGYGTALSLSNSGEEVTLISDGGNWRVFMHSGPHIKRGQGVLTIADRLAAAPGSAPEAGTLYISTGSATWGSTSVANHDVVMHTTGGAYVKFTPPTDCGWIAYVQDEDDTYQFQGSAWVAPFPKAATQAQQEAGSATNVYVAPATQHLHPSAAKFWAVVTVSSGNYTLAASYNVTSITDNGTGDLTVTIATDFSSADWALLALPHRVSTASWVLSVASQAAGSVRIGLTQAGGGAIEPEKWSLVGYGDQA